MCQNLIQDDTRAGNFGNNLDVFCLSTEQSVRSLAEWLWRTGCWSGGSEFAAVAAVAAAMAISRSSSSLAFSSSACSKARCIFMIWASCISTRLDNSACTKPLVSGNIASKIRLVYARHQEASHVTTLL